jgi:hypothetical protein
MKQLSPKRLRRKNSILKKKIEAMSGNYETINPLPPEVENQFLENTIAFEEQYQKRRKLQTVFKRIGKPNGFKPVIEIPEENIEQEWNELYYYLLEHGIDLQVCSPNIGPRELYRFATEELFKKKTESFIIPGLTTCFIYDEFHPDHAYDNQVIASSYCIERFFNRREFYDHHFAKKIAVNNHKKLLFEEFTKLVKGFWRKSDKPKSFEVKVIDSVVNKSFGKVSGTYKISASKMILNSKPQNWYVELVFDRKCNWWRINNIQIEGIDL